MEVKLFGSIEEALQVLKENEPKLVRWEGTNICIVRRENTLIAFHNECPHRGESLHKGVVNYLGEIVCPLHSYRFSLSTGECTHPCGELKMIPVIVRGAVFLQIGD